jgi:hypothetical protein
MDDVTNTRDLAGVYRDIGYIDGETFLYDVQPGGPHTEVAWA